MKDVYLITASFVGEISRDFKGYVEMAKKAGYKGLELFNCQSAFPLNFLLGSMLHLIDFSFCCLHAGLMIFTSALFCLVNDLLSLYTGTCQLFLILLQGSFSSCSIVVSLLNAAGDSFLTLF